MFARQYRLPASIRLTAPIVVHSPLFLMRIATNNLSYNRYGFLVSKKVDKRSVVRNRVKRRVRACLEKLNPQVITGHDFLLSIKKESVDQKPEILSDVLIKILVDKKLLK